MRELSIIERIRTGKGLCLAGLAGLGLIVDLAILSSPAGAAQVPVRDGQEVRLALHNVLTTENVIKDDTVDFDVAEDVVVNGHIVISRGALAQGKVVRVRGAGKKRSKDASVTFQFVWVRTVDNQQLQLRAVPYKKKGESKENEIEESSPIPGYADRVIGAEKGKVYPAFIASSAIVNAPEMAPVAPSAARATPTPPAAVQPGVLTPPPAAPPANQVAPTAPAVPALGETETASVEFNSNPAGADILIDSSFVGNTPSTLRVAPGRHVIEFRLSGYRAWIQTMVVVPGSHPTVRKNLEKQ